MPKDKQIGARLVTRFKTPLPGGLGEWSTGVYLLFALTIAVSAALMALFPFILPFLSVKGHDITACLVALLYDHITRFNPLSFTQLIDPSRLAPRDMLAKWIYLPVLGLISFLLTLPSHFDTSVEEPSGRHAFAGAAALASLLYVVLLLAYPIDKVIYRQCACADPVQSVQAAIADLRWGFYVALALGLYNLLANEFLMGVAPFRKWTAPLERKQSAGHEDKRTRSSKEEVRQTQASHTTGETKTKLRSLWAWFRGLWRRPQPAKAEPARSEEAPRIVVQPQVSAPQVSGPDVQVHISELHVTINQARAAQSDGDEHQETEGSSSKEPSGPEQPGPSKAPSSGNDGGTPAEAGSGSTSRQERLPDSPPPPRPIFPRPYPLVILPEYRDETPVTQPDHADQAVTDKANGASNPPQEPGSNAAQE